MFSYVNDRDQQSLRSPQTLSLCALSRLSSEGVDLLSKFLQVSKRLAGFFLVCSQTPTVFKLFPTSAEVVPGYDIIETVWACTFVLTVDSFETSVRGEEEDLSRGVHDSLLLWEPWEESDGAS